MCVSEGWPIVRKQEVQGSYKGTPWWSSEGALPDLQFRSRGKKEASIVIRVLLGGQCFQVSVATYDNLFPFPWKKHTIEQNIPHSLVCLDLLGFHTCRAPNYFAVHFISWQRIFHQQLRAEESPMYAHLRDVVDKYVPQEQLPVLPALSCELHKNGDGVTTYLEGREI